MSNLCERLRSIVAKESISGMDTRGAVREAADEIKRLQAIVAKLPVTKDGVPVVPRMRVWLDAETTWYRGQQKGEVKEVCVSWVGTETMPMMVELPSGVGWHIIPYRVYSTRQAAEAAELKARGE